MMTFYTGKDHRLYEKKFNELMEYFAPEILKKNKIKQVTRASVFRHMIDVLYEGLKNKKSE